MFILVESSQDVARQSRTIFRATILGKEERCHKEFSCHFFPEVFLRHRVDLLSDQANYHAAPAPALYFLDSPGGRHVRYERGWSKLAVAAVSPIPCR